MIINAIPDSIASMSLKTTYVGDSRSLERILFRSDWSNESKSSIGRLITVLTEPLSNAVQHAGKPQSCNRKVGTKWRRCPVTCKMWHWPAIPITQLSSLCWLVDGRCFVLRLICKFKARTCLSSKKLGTGRTRRLYAKVFVQQ